MAGPGSCSFRHGDAALRSSGPGGHHTSWSLLYLRQRRLRLGQPEGHVHRAVQLDGGGQLGAGLAAVSDRGIQLPEAEVAVGHERPHAELLGQGEGLAVVGFRLRALRGLAPRRDLAKEAQCLRLVAAFLVRTGVRQRMLGEGVRLLQAAG